MKIIPFELNNTLIFLLFFLFFLSCSKTINEDYQKVNEKESQFLSGKIIPDSDFLGDEKCKDCHQQEYKNWKGSHHDKAMQIAGEKTMLGNFNNQKYKSQGVLSHFFIRDNDFYVNTEGPDGKYHDLQKL